ncbi:hypothetical protein CZ809_02147 [Photobacterium piscicola]|uniref:Uncharacterized protein n=1 Tax=Photobacterium piscicola TaxID=1378299 RepID=A0A1T5I0M6_9GAMM|nr:hypothetical protein CZ809_02147 [Photobacterium piscicola]
MSDRAEYSIEHEGEGMEKNRIQNQMAQREAINTQPQGLCLERVTFLISRYLSMSNNQFQIPFSYNLIQVWEK